MAVQNWSWHIWEKLTSSRTLATSRRNTSTSFASPSKLSSGPFLIPDIQSLLDRQVSWYNIQTSNGPGSGGFLVPFFYNDCITLVSLNPVKVGFKRLNEILFYLILYLIGLLESFSGLHDFKTWIWNCMSKIFKNCLPALKNRQNSDSLICICHFLIFSYQYQP